MALHGLKARKNTSNEEQVFVARGFCFDTFLQLDPKQPSHRQFGKNIMTSDYWISIEKQESSETIIKL